MLTVSLSHFLVGFSLVLGDFASLSAELEVVDSEATVVDSLETMANPRPMQKTAWDQVLVQGQLQSGAMASIHYRGGGRFSAKGSTDLLWEIQGTEGHLQLKLDGPSGHINASDGLRYLACSMR